MDVKEKLPIVVGVTGHRNIVKEDEEATKALVRESLQEVQALCKVKGAGGENTPVIMLNAFAQGADMLCAQVAFDLGIEVYALLPCPEEEYRESFDNEEDKAKLHDYLTKVKRTIIAPDIEQNKKWLKDQVETMTDADYRYRQLGIYMAEHSHILLALWDGKEPKTPYGCGTVEVIHFALKHNFLDKGNFFRPCTVTDTAVIWIKSRRQGSGAEADIRRKWLTLPTEDDKQKAKLAESKEAQKAPEASDTPPTEKKKVRPLYVESDTPPAFLQEIVAHTAEYNRTDYAIPEKETQLWKTPEALDDYRRGLRYHYAKADDLARTQNQKPYTNCLVILAVLGTLLALAFLIYDDASLPFMIFICTGLIIGIAVIYRIGSKKAFHADYIKYRALAEALRIQFYLSACLEKKKIITNVCDLYSWTQKVDMAWIEQAIRALAVVHEANLRDIAADEIIDAWIGENEDPEGQLHYHTRKKQPNLKEAERHKRASKVLQCITIALYILLSVLEVVTYACSALRKSFFWNSTAFASLSWRSFGAIFLGFVTAGSLLLSSYYGKLSYDRRADDNVKMQPFYAAACARWQQVRDRGPAAVEKFVLEIAREEIVENGIWCSYMGENNLEINV